MPARRVNRCGLANSTTYTFQVRAVNSVGPGAGSNVVQARTPGEPAQVGGLSVSGGRNRIDASWSAPNDNGKPITHYRVDRIPGGVSNENGRSTRSTGLPDDTRYEVRVQACNAIGCGRVERDARPPAPTRPQPTRGHLELVRRRPG